MFLWMIRHAEARSAWETGGSDFDRPLTKEGRERFTDLCQRVKDEQPRPDLILHSPRVRAVQTAEILRDALDLNPERVEAVAGLSDHATLADLQQLVQFRGTEAVAIVGHQPYIGRLTMQFLGGGDVRFTPGTIAAIAFPDGRVADARGRLEWHDAP